MKIRSLTIENGLFCLAFLLALGVRFLRLGVPPLSDFEASWALQAWDLAHGARSVLGAQPGYVLLTGSLFYVFGSSNALARLLSALAGSLLIWLPFLFRRSLGTKTALAAAFGLALNPGLAALSTLVGGPLIAMAGGLLALGLAVNRKWAQAGFFGGLALLGGPAVLQGALGLALAWGVWTGLLRRERPAEAAPILPEPGLESAAAPPPIFHDNGWRTGLLVGGGTLLFAGSLFFIAPQGLAALFETLPVYLNGWVQPSGVPASRLLAALVIYQPLVVVFGLIAGARAWFSRAADSADLGAVETGIESKIGRFLGLWALAALLLALAYPGRQTGDLAWVLLPLWGLAAAELIRNWQAKSWERLPAMGQAILITLLLALAWLNLAGLADVFGDPQVIRLRWAVIAGTLALGTVTSVLIALGWSPVVAQRGLVWGVGLALGLYGLSNLWGLTQLRPNGGQELWRPVPVTEQVDLLTQTLGDLSEWHTGRRDALEIIVTVPQPALHWVLREWGKARFETALAAGGAPEVIITPSDQAELKWANAYRGQDFALQVGPGWEGALPPDWINWLVFRSAPLSEKQVIVWVRTDIFPDGVMAPVFSEPENLEEDSVPGPEE